MIAVLIIVGKKSITLKNPDPFNPLFNSTAKSSARGISMISFPAERTTVLSRDSQYAGSRIKIRTKLSNPIKVNLLYPS
ncbi:hypothetical protein [Clostridium sp. WB02_MRS01]|uniref:hypothetical protein n=1 Tax=Clostridium sp. WB02_MRS01 TaxID=2605777 RepID=UPI0025709410|nr:hypothetical protein [Clostridium sp. WB02_MRS01]